MIEKIIVVAPTTAVPMSTGLAVALKVLPAPSFSSRKCLAFSKLTSKPKSFLISSLMFGMRLDERELVDRLRVVGDRAVGVDGDGDRAHAEEAEGDQAEGEHRRGHRRAAASSSPMHRDAVGDAHQDDDDDAHPVGGEVAGDEAGEDVERGAALARRGDDLAHVAPTRSR